MARALDQRNTLPDWKLPTGPEIRSAPTGGDKLFLCPSVRKMIQPVSTSAVEHPAKAAAMCIACHNYPTHLSLSHLERFVFYCFQGKVGRSCCGWGPLHFWIVESLCLRELELVSHTLDSPNVFLSASTCMYLYMISLKFWKWYMKPYLIHRVNWIA